MKTRPYLIALAILPICVLALAGCSQQDGVHSPTAPCLEGPTESAFSLGHGHEAPRLVPPRDREMVTKTLGSEGGAIESGKVSVLFPKGSLRGKTEVSLVVWGDDEVVRSVALLVGLDGATGRLMGAKTDSAPIVGTTDEIADQLLAFSGMVDHVQLVVARGPAGRGPDLGLLDTAGRRTTDVERPHGQLRTRLTDRLRGDDADRHAHLDHMAA